MKILNFGSLNLDYVYAVKEIVRPGETIDSFDLQCYPGGKGLNQSLAIRRAGHEIFHAGMIGVDGESLRELLAADGVDCTYLKVVEKRTGNAIIQVDESGQNCIILYGGANRMNDPSFSEAVLKNFGQGDILLLQNEINGIDLLIEKAYQKKMYIVLNPSPINDELLKCDFSKVSLFIMNEHEGAMITGVSDESDILRVMRQKYQHAEVVLTLGERGSIYQYQEMVLKQPAIPAAVKDTTAAGDTFTGYYLALKADGKTIEECLEQASKAAALAVSKKGAAGSIPYQDELK